MTARLSSLVLLAALLIVPATAKDKKKVTLPEYVLRATTVRVVVNPDAGEPLDNPMANSTARENVERASDELGPLSTGSRRWRIRSADRDPHRRPAR